MKGRKDNTASFSIHVDLILFQCTIWKHPVPWITLSGLMYTICSISEITRWTTLPHVYKHPLFLIQFFCDDIKGFPLLCWKWWWTPEKSHRKGDFYRKRTIFKTHIGKNPVDSHNQIKISMGKWSIYFLKHLFAEILLKQLGCNKGYREKG